MTQPDLHPDPNGGAVPESLEDRVARLERLVLTIAHHHTTMSRDIPSADGGVPTLADYDRAEPRCAAGYPEEEFPLFRCRLPHGHDGDHVAVGVCYSSTPVPGWKEAPDA